VKLKALTPAEYLTGDDVIDLSHPSIKVLAGSLRAENGDDAQFSLTTERLAWPGATELGEHDYPQLLVSPYPDVVESLRGATDALALCRGGLPVQLEPELAGQKEA